MSSAKAKSRGWTGFLDRGKRKDTDPASSARPPALSFDDPTFDDASPRLSPPAEQTLLDGIPALQKPKESEATIPPDDVPAGVMKPLSLNLPASVLEQKIGSFPERTELVDAASLGLDFAAESTDTHAKPIRTHEVPGVENDTDRPVKDTEPPPPGASTDDLNEADDSSEDGPVESEAPEDKRPKIKTFRPIKERNRTLSKARSVDIPSPPAEAPKRRSIPPPDQTSPDNIRPDIKPRGDSLGLDGPAGLRPQGDAVRVGDDEAELTMLHPAVAIGIAPAPGASPRVPPAEPGRLRVPDAGPSLELPPPGSAPQLRLDKPNSPLSNLEAEPPREYNPLTDNQPALEAAVWATNNLARLKTLFAIIPISMFAGLILAGIFSSTQSMMMGARDDQPKPPPSGMLLETVKQPANGQNGPDPTQGPATAPKPKRSGLAISSQPPYAMVSVNGQEIGRTPLVLPTPEQDVGLHVTIVADDHKRWEADVTVRADFGGVAHIVGQSYVATSTSSHIDPRSARYPIEIRLESTLPK